jgi:hypothetical protein
MEIVLGLLILFLFMGLLIGIIITIILGVMFVAGLILLIVGIVSWICTKRAGVKKVYPKVLILVSLPLLIVPTLYVSKLAIEANDLKGSNQAYVTDATYESYETLYENEVDAFLTAAESGDEEANQ